MKPIRFVLLAAMLSVPQAAFAETADGSGALALAALVGTASPLLGAPQKNALAKLLDGDTKVSFLTGQTIVVKVGKLTCKAGNVDITIHSCDLVFSTRTTTLTGRRAHELFATLSEIGVLSDGAAGSIFEVVTNLACTVDPNEVKQMSGGGAHCDYAPSN
jgi:hypothetical protein